MLYIYNFSSKQYIVGEIGCGPRNRGLSVESLNRVLKSNSNTQYNVISILDAQHNILLINKGWYKD